MLLIKVISVVGPSYIPQVMELVWYASKELTTTKKLYAKWVRERNQKCFVLIAKVIK